MGNINYKHTSLFIEDLLNDTDFVDLRKYAIENDVVYVDDIFHELQDYENKMI